MNEMDHKVEDKTTEAEKDRELSIFVRNMERQLQTISLVFAVLVLLVVLLTVWLTV